MNSVKSFYRIITVAIVILSLCLGIGFKIEQDAIKLPTIETGVDEDMLDDEQTEQEEKEQTEQEEKSEVKKYKNGEGFECYTDAINFLYSCKGFRAETSTVGVGTGSIAGISASITQYVKETMIISGDYYYKAQTCYADSSYGSNNVQYFYSNNGGKSVDYAKYEINGDHTANRSKTITSGTCSKEELLTKRIDMQAYKVPTALPKKKNELVNFDRLSDKKYYIIKFNLNMKNLPEEYKINILNEGGLSEVTINSITMTFYIEKETLYIRKIEKIDNYTGHKGDAISFTTNPQSQIYFKDIDKDLTPAHF